MANTNNPNGFNAVKKLGGGAFPLFPYMTKSNLALTAGDALILLTNGVVDKAVVGSTAIFGVVQTTVSAVAATRKPVLVIPAVEDIVWSAQFSSSATPGNFGVSRDINGATGVMLLTTTTAQGVARMIAYEPSIKNEAGPYARVLFVWQKSQWTGQA